MLCTLHEHAAWGGSAAHFARRGAQWHGAGVWKAAANQPKGRPQEVRGLPLGHRRFTAKDVSLTSALLVEVASGRDMQDMQACGC